MTVKTFSDYKDRDYLTIIPSKGRNASIHKVQEMFPNAILYINEDELKDYEPFATLDIITHKETLGIGAVMNSIFRECTKNNIRYSAIFDDDKFWFRSLVGNRPRDLSTEQIEQAISNGCQVLEDMEAYLYLFSTASSIIKYSQADPVKVGFSLPQGALIHRNDKMGKYKLGMYYYEDFDFCMEYILKHRYMIIELRYLCISKGELNEGGCNSFRTSKNEEGAQKWVKKKWGQYVNFVKNQSGTIRPTSMVKRTQK
jgi:hypothetical protein